MYLEAHSQSKKSGKSEHLKIHNFKSIDIILIIYIKYNIKLLNVILSNIICPVCLAPLGMHNCTKYEGSKPCRYGEVKKYRLVASQLLGPQVYTGVKFETSVFRCVLRRAVHTQRY